MRSGTAEALVRSRPCKALCHKWYRVYQRSTPVSTVSNRSVAQVNAPVGSKRPAPRKPNTGKNTAGDATLKASEVATLRASKKA